MTDTAPEPTRPPFAFTPAPEGETPTRYRQRVIFEAIGAASTAWQSLAGAGEFDEAFARSIGDALAEALEASVTPATDTTAPTVPTETELEATARESIADAVVAVTSLPPSRATALVLTKLDESRLWLGEVVSQ